MKTIRNQFICIVLAVLAFGCSKDKELETENSAILVGTTWASRSGVNPTTNYRILNFKDKKNVEWTTKNGSSEEETKMTLTYTIKDNILTIGGDIVWTGEIGETRIDLKPHVGNNFLTFMKE